MAERALSAGALAAIAAGVVRPVIFYEGEYVSGGVTQYLRLFTGVGQIEWDGKTWTGGRELLSFSPIRESTSLEAIGFSVRLAGMDASILSTVLQSMRKNKAGRLWLGFMRPVAYLDLPGTTGNYASTPDSAAVSVTGDIDIRVKVAMDDWTPSARQGVARQWNLVGNKRAWDLSIDTSGKLIMVSTADGSTQRVATSTVATGIADGSAHWIRVTRASATGTVTFYTSSDGETWTQLGTTVATTAGTIFDSDQPLIVGMSGSGGDFQMVGKAYYAELRNGIDGPVVARFDPLRFSSGQLTATAETGEVWTINQSGSPKAVIVPQADEVIPDPYPLRRGRFDVAPITRDAAAGTITIEARYEGPLARLLVPNVRHYTHEDQQLRLAGDRGFEQVPALQDTQDLWGNEQVGGTPPRWYTPKQSNIQP